MLTKPSAGGEVDLLGNASLKAYFCPGARSEITGIPAMALLTDCTTKLGLAEAWSQLSAFVESCPARHNVTPLFIAAGSVPSHLNSAKIYFRTQANTLGELIQYMTMGGILPIDNEDISTAVKSLRRLWHLLFGADIKDDTPVYSLQPSHPTSGFLVYYDIGRDLPFTRPKVCITVKHFCKNDEIIAQAISQYYREVGCPDVADSYEKKLRSI
jgi:tryptophan 7-dimethylallyltransferase